MPTLLPHSFHQHWVVESVEGSHLQLQDAHFLQGRLILPRPWIPIQCSLPPFLCQTHTAQEMRSAIQKTDCLPTRLPAEWWFRNGPASSTILWRAPCAFCGFMFCIAQNRKHFTYHSHKQKTWMEKWLCFPFSNKCLSLFFPSHKWQYTVLLLW